MLFYILFLYNDRIHMREAHAEIKDYSIRIIKLLVDQQQQKLLNPSHL